MTALTVDSIWRYPVKGLAGEQLAQAEIAANGRGIAGDRRWMLAVRDASAMFRDEAPWRPWQHALTLKSCARLARFSASLDGDILAIKEKGGDEARGKPSVTEERRTIEEFMRDRLENNDVTLLDCEERPAWDYDGTALTALFLASTGDLSRQVGAPLQAERFRANIVISGGESQDEMSRREVRINQARLQILEGVQRCAATQVNPQSGERDINVPAALFKFYRENIMGVKCAVLSGGRIVKGDAASLT